MCQIIIGQCVQLSLDNVCQCKTGFLRSCHNMSNIFSSKSHFVQPNVVCPAPAVPTFCTPAFVCLSTPLSWKHELYCLILFCHYTIYRKVQALIPIKLYTDRLHFKISAYADGVLAVCVCTRLTRSPCPQSAQAEMFRRVCLQCHLLQTTKINLQSSEPYETFSADNHILFITTI